MRRMLAFSILSAALAVPAAADRGDDDLQVVRKAVASASVPAAAQEKPRPPAEEEPMPPQARRPLKSSDLKWLHVRVAPKAGGKSGRVSVNVPLGLVRMFGDDWPIPTGPGCRRHDRCHLTLGEILRALDSGQTLVDIEDDEATVKVWVE
ncbi:MAG TPA: hypothetical protein VII62_00885 [Vicinamibacteria bacterium]|jgi:hypothetical protein